MITLCLRQTLLLYHIAVSSSRDGIWQATCGASCRMRAAKLIPTVVHPMPEITKAEAANCELKFRCGSALCCLVGKNASQDGAALAPRPTLIVAMTTIPPRMKVKRHLTKAVESMYRQTRLPDHVIVSASKSYTRFDGAVPLLEDVLPARDGLDRIMCDADFGPATKLLCALPRMRELAAKAKAKDMRSGVAARGHAWAVLVDEYA